MAPPTPAIHPSTLPTAILADTNGKRRKDLPQDFDLKRDCALSSLTQYNCSAQELEVETALGSRKTTEIVCEPVVRLFRK